MAPAGVPGAKKGILKRLGSGEVVVGGDSFLITLEKRGYVKAGLWTLEVAADHPDAGLEPRVGTRWDIKKYAKEAYNLGVWYISGPRRGISGPSFRQTWQLEK
ncbi:S-methylmethionine--homocysteine S-methyltransferase BHMT2-like [Lontra canadensis]|uniref:S-methylmethionine--homocysteine S-methyltransferase BHMT2-like n=1 Tax=Lontra canadensis TaxID=76717 RepID=UPI0013F2FC69|nr:S-methylmethionine--homocysteine S-methyltransferase BHMT2-like [Lontra canadensis]XP_032703745.1 S-methylmethionine--homocysteine S-methyltransferase BHMT2-like [Lontra canadensis]